jgi:hypothetical protein
MPGLGGGHTYCYERGICMDFSSLFSASGLNQGNYQTMYQNFQGQISQWVQQAKDQAQQQGIFDLGQNVPNLLNNQDIPQAPGREIYFKLAELEDQAQKAVLRELEDFNNECISHKEKVFASNHYEFDENGKPVLGDDGKPKLVEGAESADQNKLRTSWESQSKDEKRAKDDAELEAYVKSTIEESQSLLNELRSTKDPERIKQIYERMGQLSQGEIDMRGRIYLEDLKVGMEGLPDVINGGSLTDFVDQRVQQVKDFIGQTAQDVINSPEAQAIWAYQQKMASYTAGLWQQYGVNTGS